jgi:hypothetical protein
MKPTIFKVASLLSFGALAYAVGRLGGPLIAAQATLSADRAQQAAPLDRVPSGARSRTARPTLAATPPIEQTLAQPLRLPPLGTLDEQIIAGNEQLGRLRDDLLRKLLSRSRPCRQMAQDGSTSIAVTLDVRLTAGVASVTRLAALTVKNGAPLSPPVQACLRNTFADQEIIRPKPLPPGTPPDQVARYAGRWRGLGTFEGTLVLPLSLSDRCGPARTN